MQHREPRVLGGAGGGSSTTAACAAAPVRRCSDATRSKSWCTSPKPKPRSSSEARADRTSAPFSVALRRAASSTTVLPIPAGPSRTRTAPVPAMAAPTVRSTAASSSSRESRPPDMAAHSMRRVSEGFARSRLCRASRVPGTAGIEEGGAVGGRSLVARRPRVRATRPRGRVQGDRQAPGHGDSGRTFVIDPGRGGPSRPTTRGRAGASVGVRQLAFPRRRSAGAPPGHGAATGRKPITDDRLRRGCAWSSTVTVGVPASRHREQAPRTGPMTARHAPPTRHSPFLGACCFRTPDRPTAPCRDPDLVIWPWRRVWPELCSDGTRPRKLINCPARAKRVKSLTSAHNPTAVRVSIPRRQRSRAAVSAQGESGRSSPIAASGGAVKAHVMA